MDEGVGDAAFMDEAIKVGNGWATQHPATTASPVDGEGAELAVSGGNAQQPQTGGNAWHD
jgi:hypothetical protein